MVSKTALTSFTSPIHCLTESHSKVDAISIDRFWRKPNCLSDCSRLLSSRNEDNWWWTTFSKIFKDHRN